MQLSCSLEVLVVALNLLPVLVMGNKEAEVVESRVEAADRLVVAVADLKLVEEAVGHRVVEADHLAVVEPFKGHRVVDRGSQRAEADLQSQIHLLHSVARAWDDCLALLRLHEFQFNRA